MVAIMLRPLPSVVSDGNSSVCLSVGLSVRVSQCVWPSVCASSRSGEVHREHCHQQQRHTTTPPPKSGARTVRRPALRSPVASSTAAVPRRWTMQPFRPPLQGPRPEARRMAVGPANNSGGQTKREGKRGNEEGRIAQSGSCWSVACCSIDWQFLLLQRRQ